MKNVYSVRLRVLVISAVLAAMSIVLGKFAAFSVGNSIRVSFENLPIIVGAIMFGPVAGALTAVVADLLGCVLRGYSIIPLVTAGAAAVALCAGVTVKYVFRRISPASVIAGVCSAHAIGSVLIKSVALYLTYATPMSVLVLRLPAYALTAAAESAIIIIIMRSKELRKYAAWCA